MIVSNLLSTIATILNMLLTVYFYVIIVSAILSWVNPDPYNPIVRAIRGVTEPVFSRIRRTFPFLATSGIDFTPLAVLLIIMLLQGVVVESLYDMAGRPAITR